jgi:hypothetical protein
VRASRATLLLHEWARKQLQIEREAMAVDIRELVGDANMTLANKEKVISILGALQQPATTRRFLYARWARLVGVEPIPADIDRVAPWSAGGT